MSTCLSFGFLSRPALVWKSSAHRWSGKSENRFPVQLVSPRGFSSEIKEGILVLVSPRGFPSKIKEGILDHHSDLPNPCVHTAGCVYAY